MSNKKLYLLLGIFAIIFTFFGGSLAYWQWNTMEEQQTTVTFSTTADFSCAVDGGGDITNTDVDLAPADCTNEKYAIKRTIKVMPMLNTDKTNVMMDLWLDIGSIGTGLSASQNFRYALTTDADSCKTGVVESGTFTGKSANQKVEIMNDKIYSQTYTDTYYLYVWLDKEETSDSTMDQEFSLSLNGSCTNSAKGEPYYVVYSEDDTSLRFYKEEEGVIIEGEQYEGRTATNVYRAYENDVYTSEATRPWDGVKSLVTNIVIEDEISPISTAYWFKIFTKVSNIDVLKLNTSRTINMNSMFERVGYDSSILNFLAVGIDKLNTSNVKDMYGMLMGIGGYATSFNIGDLSEWNTSNVTNMKYMFYKTGYSTNEFDIGDLSDWDVSNVTNMYGMFWDLGYSAQEFDIGNLDNWNTSKVIDMRFMFNFAGYNATTFNIGNLDNWDVSSVTNMRVMFQNAGLKANVWDIGNLDNWDVSHVTNMGGMFSFWDKENNICPSNITTFNIGDLSRWDVSNVTNMGGMFQCVGYNLEIFDIGNLSNWDVSKVTDMSYMFNQVGYSSEMFIIGDLSNWDVSSVTNMYGMFSNAGYNSSKFDIGNIGKWNVGKVENMYGMFNKTGFSAEEFNIGDLSNWDVSNVKDMRAMFQDAGRNAIIFNIGNLSGWDVSKVTDMSYMFNRTGYSAQEFDIGNLDNWDVSSVTDMSGMFKRYSDDDGHSLNTTFNIGNLSGWNTSNVTNMDSMFKSAGYNASHFSQDLSGWNVPLVTTYTDFNLNVEDKVTAPNWVNENVDSEE